VIVPFKVVCAGAIIAVVVEGVLPTTVAIAHETIIATSLSLPPTEITVC
jgi:hypothetical protein